MLIYGLDPSLRHGQLIKTEWNFPRNGLPRVIWQPIYDWKKRNPISLSVKATPVEIHTLAKEIVQGVDAPGLVGIDWDPASISWKSRRDQGIRLAFFMGYLSRVFLGIGCSTIFLTPRVVRETFGLHPRAPKEDVWKVAFERFIQNSKLELNSDIRDALILTYVVAWSLHEEKFNGRTAEAYLLS